MSDDGWVMSTALKEVVERMARDYLRGLLSGQGRLPVQAPPQRAHDRHGDIYAVTAVASGTCTVRMLNADDTTNAATDLTGLGYDAANLPAVGDRGVIVRLSDGSLYFHPGGWDYKAVAGYDEDVTQFLIHDMTGVLHWITSGEC